MKDIKEVYKVQFPEADLVQNFKFDTVTPKGTFTLEFKYFEDRWDLWVTLPSGEVRQAGVYPNLISWTENLDYGLFVKTNLAQIDYESLKLAEVYIVVWQ